MSNTMPEPTIDEVTNKLRTERDYQRRQITVIVDRIRQLQSEKRMYQRGLNETTGHIAAIARVRDILLG